MPLLYAHLYTIRLDYSIPTALVLILRGILLTSDREPERNVRRDRAMLKSYEAIYKDGQIEWLLHDH